MYISLPSYLGNMGLDKLFAGVAGAVSKSEGDAAAAGAQVGGRKDYKIRPCKDCKIRA